MTPAPLARTTRRTASASGAGQEIVESTHLGHVVVVGPDGDHLALGEVDRPTFIRSAAKPFQAAAAIELLDLDLPSDEIAISWASHRGEAHQLEAVRSILRRAGVNEQELTTPVAVPDEARPASRLGHNCSGQHALFALVGARRGFDRDDLLRPDGPLQSHVLDAMARSLGTPLAVSVDGCGAPAVAVPLIALAEAYRDLVAGPDDATLARTVRAGHDHPDLVGGEGRLETALLSAGVVAKPGAEGVFGLGWTTAGGAWGAAVKVEDGAGRAACAAAHALLTGAGIAVAWEQPAVLGGGRAVGSVMADEGVSRLVTGLPVR